jgi:hypothetical protein
MRTRTEMITEMKITLTEPQSELDAHTLSIQHVLHISHEGASVELGFTIKK